MVFSSVFFLHRAQTTEIKIYCCQFNNVVWWSHAFFIFCSSALAKWFCYFDAAAVVAVVGTYMIIIIWNGYLLNFVSSQIYDPVFTMCERPSSCLWRKKWKFSSQTHWGLHRFLVLLLFFRREFSLRVSHPFVIDGWWLVWSDLSHFHLYLQISTHLYQTWHFTAFQWIFENSIIFGILNTNFTGNYRLIWI